MSATAGGIGRSTVALFSRVSSRSGMAITPLNNCAASNNPTLPQLYIVHSVSGAAGTDFLDLAERLESKVRLYGIQAPPKLMTNLEFGKSVESLAAYYADALVEFQPSGILFVGGYCIGAVVALAMANNLRARGRDVGPLFAIDGVPENTQFALKGRMPRYWLELSHNLYRWVRNPRLIRNRTMYSVVSSITINVSAIGKNVFGMNRAQRWGGGYSVESIMDVSRFEPVHLSFINRLFNAIFQYVASPYTGDVVVYEAAVKPPLRLPQIGRIWQNLASKTQVVEIVGTHYHMMRDPYVDAIATDLIKRISGYPPAAA